MIIFVYNANSGKINLGLDIAHKVLSPSTYDCKLCQMTFGFLKEKQIWKDFRENLKEDLLFLHRDEFEKRFVHKQNYPVVLRQDKEELQVLVSKDEIEAMNSVEDLIARIKEIVNL